jgi:hypothetical protein
VVVVAVVVRAGHVGLDMKIVKMSFQVIT